MLSPPTPRTEQRHVDHSTIVRCATMRADRHEDQMTATTKIAVISKTKVGSGALSMKNER